MLVSSVFSDGATEVTYCIVSDEDVDDPTADDKKNAMTTIGRSFMEERTAGSESKPRSVSYPQLFNLHMYILVYNMSSEISNNYTIVVVCANMFCNWPTSTKAMKSLILVLAFIPISMYD